MMEWDLVLLPSYNQQPNTKDYEKKGKIKFALRSCPLPVFYAHSHIILFWI